MLAPTAETARTRPPTRDAPAVPRTAQRGDDAAGEGRGTGINGPIPRPGPLADRTARISAGPECHYQCEAGNSR